MEIPQIITVNERSFQVLQLLGKGKGGYSYLCSALDAPGRLYVVKQIHHEPCAYYQFGDKLASELADYRRLKEIGISMPELLEADIRNERILKEYINGPTIAELVADNRMCQAYYDQIEDMCKLLYPANTNIDYYPTNFVVSEGNLYYIDYECNDYMMQWDYENWGKQYWYPNENA